MRQIFYALLIVWSVASQGCASRNQDQLLVSAASSVIKPLNAIVAKFERETGNQVNLQFAATGQLAQQIEHGAPVDLFLAADTMHIDRLIINGRLKKESKRIYATGQLVSWQHENSQVLIEDIDDLKRPEVKRIAIANPSYAPYGIAAKEALTTLGLWGKRSPKIVYADNVRQALQFAETGNVDGALIARSLIMNRSGNTAFVPKSYHDPINHSLAIVSSTRNPAGSIALANYICGKYGRTVLRAYGFTFPQETDCE